MVYKNVANCQSQAKSSRAKTQLGTNTKFTTINNPKPLLVQIHPAQFWLVNESLFKDLPYLVIAIYQIRAN